MPISERLARLGSGVFARNDLRKSAYATRALQQGLPELVDLSRTFGGLGMHCCADAEHQFPSFRKIPNFYAFNRVAAKHGYDPILEHLGGPQGPVHVLWSDDTTIERLIKTAPEGTRFIFNRSFEEVDEAKAWLEKMRKISPRTD